MSALAAFIEQVRESLDGPTSQPARRDPAVESIVAECSIAAGEDFNELWSTRRVSPGGTRERDSQLFVLGAAYGLAWAMSHLTLDGDGNVTMYVDDEGDALPTNRVEPDADSQCVDQPTDDCQVSPEES